LELSEENDFGLIRCCSRRNGASTTDGVRPRGVSSSAVAKWAWSSRRRTSGVNEGW